MSATTERPTLHFSEPISSLVAEGIVKVGPTPKISLDESAGDRKATKSISPSKTLAAVNHYLGRYGESEELARHALALNPNDPDTLAQLGWRLAVRGKFEEGIPILQSAVDRSLNPPGWYFHLIAIDLCLKGDYETMLRVAERSAINGTGFSQALIAIANGALGNVHAAHDALEKMSKYEPLARDPAAYVRRHGATDEIVDAVVEGLRNAGWAAPTTN